jgi:predicted nucleic acid-binding protein
MPDSKAFIDSNVMIYLLSANDSKADHAETVLRISGSISVQVLNEIANVAVRKLDMSWDEINEVLTLIRMLCPVEPLTIETHAKGRLIAERYGLGVYDAMIVAAALIGGCDILYSEHMQDGFLIDNQLRICNPFERSPEQLLFFFNWFPQHGVGEEKVR